MRKRNEAHLKFQGGISPKPAAGEAKEDKKNSILANPDTACEDFKKMAEIRNSRGRIDIDSYISFLDQFNRFAGNPKKPFRPMTGDNFKL